MGRKSLPSTEASAMNAARKTKGGPRGVTMPCGWCGQPLTARRMREHFTTCAKRPALEAR